MCEFVPSLLAFAHCHVHSRHLDAYATRARTITLFIELTMVVARSQMMITLPVDAHHIRRTFRVRHAIIRQTLPPQWYRIVADAQLVQTRRLPALVSIAVRFTMRAELIARLGRIVAATVVRAGEAVRTRIAYADAVAVVALGRLRVAGAVGRLRAGRGMYAGYDVHRPEVLSSFETGRLPLSIR